MMKQLYSKIPALVLTLIVGLMATSTAFGTATIVIENGDGPGVGFNDPTPVPAVGGNNGTTLGQQRLNAFQFAANIWGSTLVSGPTITIHATWENLTCTANTGTLGSAGATSIRGNFPGAVFTNTWYSVALANALSNSDLNGSTAEINARFNSNLGNTGCLEGLSWYYGFDTNPGTNGIDLVTVLIHEFAHGFGFQTFTDRATGAQPSGFPSIYDKFLFDSTTGKTWPQMSDAERVASALNTNNLVWNGPQVVSDVPSVLVMGVPILTVNSPAAITGDYQVNTAAFGSALTSSGVTAEVVQALDPSNASGTLTTDGCSALTNAAAVSGKIALIDRGTCTFVVKVKNAQNAGAVGVIIANNVVDGIPPGMGGTDPTITIPVLSITQTKGNKIKAQLASGVNATLRFDFAARAGADSSGRARMYAPDPLEGGSSVSHFDWVAFPNQLMEPVFSADLSHSVAPPQDLTFSLLKDIGWLGAGGPPPSPTPTPSPPANNNFANAQTISGCTGGVIGTNVGANKEPGEPSHEPDGDPGGGSVWYQWTAPATGVVTITTLGSNYDTELAVYTGNAVGSLTTIVKNDDQAFPDIVTSSVNFPATAGTVYKIAVDGYGNDRGNIVLNWSQNGCTDVWQSTTLTNSQVEIKTWTTGGRTSAYLKLLFPNAGYRVTNWGSAVRTGNDFTADASIEKFSGGSVQAVTTTAQIYDLGPLADGNYTFTFKNSGTLVKSQSFTVSSTVPPPNPIDDAGEFVKQQYRDFLNREADPAGLAFWTNNITKCSDPAQRPPGQTEAQCTLRQRETTSGAFFLSPEFQYTGYYVYRMYVGALGRQPKLSEFTPDAQFVGNGIIVNGALSAAKINQNKADFAQQFVNCTDPAKYRCAEFKVMYDKLTDQQYVDALFVKTGVNASASDRSALVAELAANPTTGRGSVLQKIVDGINVISEGNQQFNTTYGQAFYNSEFNRAFVQLEYFGYMKRDPDDAGYAFWLGKLNLFGGNFVNAEMVLAFISSPEYRARFGQP